MTHYSNLKIPAYLFFEIAESNDLKSLVIKGKPTKNQLAKAWEKIYDAYYKRLDDRQMERAMDSKKRIGLLKMKIDIVENVLYVLSLINAPKELLVTVIQSLKKIGIHLDETKAVPLAVLNTLQVDLVNLRTELDVEVEKYAKMTSGEGLNFTDDVVGIENVLERSIPEDISLDKYISLKKSAKDKIARLKANQAKNKKK